MPKVSESGVSKVESTITKAGDPLLREMLCTAADQARKIDPQIAAKYQRLMAGDRHHDSAICHLATLLVARIATCMRTGQPYQLRDVDGTPITAARAARSCNSATRSSPDAATTSGTNGCATTASHQLYEPPRGLTLLRNSDPGRFSSATGDTITLVWSHGEAPNLIVGVCLLVSAVVVC